MKFKIFFILLINLIFPGLIITEIYKKTKGSEYYNQWIEIYNNSQTNICVTNYILGDDIYTNRYYKKIILWNGINLTNKNIITNSLILPPKQYGIILDNGYKYEEQFIFEYPTYIWTTEGAALLGARTIAIGDYILLMDKKTNITDSYGTPFDNNDNIPYYGDIKGISVERIFYDKKDSEDNWGFSLDKTGYTIGKENSLTTYYQGYIEENNFTLIKYNNLIKQKIKSDMIITNITGYPCIYEINKIDNKGKFDYYFNTNILLDIDDNKLFDNSDNIFKQDNYWNLKFITGRSSSFYLVSCYIKNSFIKLFYNDITNIFYFKTIDFQSKYYKKLFINEVMYNTENYLQDWIELYNNSDNDIYIADLTFEKFTSSYSKYSYTLTDFSIRKKSYKIITVNLSNFINKYKISENKNIAEIKIAYGISSGNSIFLKDNENKIIDGICLKSSFGKTENVSLERKSFYSHSFDNNTWIESFSVDKATPLKINSCQKKYKKQTIKIKKSENILNETQDINFSLKFSNPSKFSIKIYDLKGRFVKLLYLSDRETISYDFILNYDKLKDILTKGIYYFVVEIYENKVIADKTYFIIE